MVLHRVNFKSQKTNMKICFYIIIVFLLFGCKKDNNTLFDEENVIVNNEGNASSDEDENSNTDEEENASSDEDENGNTDEEENTSSNEDENGNTDEEENTSSDAEENIKLNLRVHLMQSEAWIHPKGSEMNMWITEDDVRDSILPEMNSIWSQAKIEWTIEQIINEPIVEYTGFEEDIEYIINSKRNDQGRSDRARLPLLHKLMDPSNLSSEMELEQNLFHIYIFPFIGNTSQGNSMRPFGYHSVVGCWTNKFNGGENPEKTLLTESQTEFVRGSLARTISHELGHVLGLRHSCNNCLMRNKGYVINAEQIAISTEEARRRRSEN